MMPKSRFFITGTPRSRTAWLAAVFSTGPALCYHEPTRELHELCQRHGGRSVGVSSPSFVLRFRALRADYPRTPWLYVERDPQEALASLLVFLRPHFGAASAQAPEVIEAGLNALMARHQEEAQVLKAHPMVKVVRYEDLDNTAAAAEIWQHLLPDEPADLARWKLMGGLRIEQHAQKALKNLRCLCQ